MFIGHALLAFALAVLIAEWRGWPARRAFALGISVGAFAALPDVDVLYAVYAMDVEQLVSGARVRPGEFWGTANGVHRSMTHSLVAAAIAGPAFGLWTLHRAQEHLPRWSDRRTLAGSVVAVAALAALVLVSTLVSGVVGAFVMASFVLIGLALATCSRTHLGLSPHVVALAAVAGIGSHPWGDFFTGKPPALLYPFETRIVTERVVLSADPTLHLLVAFAVELAVVALAATVVARHLGFAPRRLVDRRATIGALYGVAAIVMVPPTIDLSYHFVFSILGVGLLCGAVRRSRDRPHTLRNLYHRLAGDPEAALRTTFTGLAGTAVALGSYAVVYLALA